MAQIGEIIYNIKNKAGAGEHSNDLILGNRQIEYNLNTLRATSATYNLSGSLSIEGFLQNIPVADLTPSKDYLSSVGIVYKTTGLPTLITAKGFGRLLSMVGSKNSIIKYQKSTPEMCEMDLLRPYVTGVYFMVDDDMYVVSKNRVPLKSVSIRGVFANPRNVLRYNNHPGAEGLEWEYPVPQNFVPKLYQDYINTEFKLDNTTPTDTVTDGEEIKQVSRAQ